jgi:rubrerythrin
MILKNLFVANRLNQQAVKLGKDIHSDRDILDEEVIQPMKINDNSSSIASTSTDSIMDDLQSIPTHEQPTVLQLIKYKHQIRIESDRRLHRQKLADLLNIHADKERVLQPDLLTKYDDVTTYEQNQQQRHDTDGSIARKVLPDETRQTSTGNVMVTSKEENELLNDENVFQTQKQRVKRRARHEVHTSRSHTPHLRQGSSARLSAQMHQVNQTSMSKKQFTVCNKCGNVMKQGDSPTSDLVRQQPSKSM